MSYSKRPRYEEFSIIPEFKNNQVMSTGREYSSIPKNPYVLPFSEYKRLPKEKKSEISALAKNWYYQHKDVIPKHMIANYLEKKRRKQIYRYQRQLPFRAKSGYEAPYSGADRSARRAFSGQFARAGRQKSAVQYGVTGEGAAALLEAQRATAAMMSALNDQEQKYLGCLMSPFDKKGNGARIPTGTDPTVGIHLTGEYIWDMSNSAGYTDGYFCIQMIPRGVNGEPKIGFFRDNLDGGTTFVDTGRVVQTCTQGGSSLYGLIDNQKGHFRMVSMGLKVRPVTKRDDIKGVLWGGECKIACNSGAGADTYNTPAALMQNANHTCDGFIDCASGITLRYSPMNVGEAIQWYDDGFIERQASTPADTMSDADCSNIGCYGFRGGVPTVVGIGCQGQILLVQWVYHIEYMTADNTSYMTLLPNEPSSKLEALIAYSNEMPSVVAGNSFWSAIANIGKFIGRTAMNILQYTPMGPAINITKDFMHDIGVLPRTSLDGPYAQDGPKPV